MMVERAYDRLVAVNPVPDPEQYVTATLDVDAALMSLEALVEDAGPRERDAAERIPQWMRWRVAAVTFVAVLAVGGALAAITLLDDDQRFEMAPETPIGVVEAFFERWNAGEVDAVMEIVDPDALINGGRQTSSDLRALVEYSLPFNGTMEGNCGAGLEPGEVTCDWLWVTPGTEALGLDSPSRRTFTVADNLITAFTTPNYAVFDNQLGRFAQERDPAGFSEACSLDGTSPIGGNGFPFNTRCGEYLADLESDFVTSLNVEAWSGTGPDLSEIETAEQNVSTAKAFYAAHLGGDLASALEMAGEQVSSDPKDVSAL